MTSHNMTHPIEQLQDQFPQSQHLTDHLKPKEWSIVHLATSLKQNILQVNQHLHLSSLKIYTVLALAQMVYIFFQSIQFKEGLKCPFLSDRDCINTFYPPLRYEASTWVFKILVDGYILLFFIHTFIFKKTYRLLCIVGILQLYWLYIHGQFKMSFLDLGGIFKIVHILIFILLLALYTIIILCYTYCKFRWQMFFLSLTVVTMVVVFFVARYSSCYFWKYGINGQIQDSSQLCRPTQPSCWIMYMEDLLDLSPMLYKTALGEKYRLNVDKFVPNPQKGSMIGFGNSNLFTDTQRYSHHFQQSVLANAYRYKTLQEALISDKKQDVYLDNIEQKYYIKVRRNETLVEERKEKFEETASSPSPPSAKNVLFLFFDSISRAEAHYKIPQTMNWFKKYSKHESYKDPQPIKADKNIEQAYEFYRSNSVGYETFQNNLAMFYGLPYKFSDNITLADYIQVEKQLIKADRRWKKNPQNVVFFGKDYQDKGFITSSSSTFCSIMNADQYKQEDHSFKPPRYDHQAYAFPCDPNFQQFGNQFSTFSGPSSATDRNLYGKKVSEYMFEYALSFFDAYKDMPKLQVLNFMEGHDFYIGSTKHVDQPFRKFLDAFQERGHSKDTAIILVSDHGQHAIDIKKLYIAEHYHNLLVMSLPKGANAKYRDAVRRNQQNLVTPFNVYYTMEHFLLGDDYDLKNMSLLSDLSFQKSCVDAKIPVYPQQICACVL